MYQSTQQLILKLRHYCAYQERAQQEVEQKLNKLGATEEQSGEVMVHLIQEGFLNEERFAKAYARGKFRMQSWGRHKIKAGLKSKNVSSPLIDLAMKEIQEEEYHKMILNLLQKYHSQAYGLQTAIQKLCSKGFEYDLVRELAETMDA